MALFSFVKVFIMLTFAKAFSAFPCALMPGVMYERNNMGLGLHSDCTARLEAKIAELLDKIEVQNKMFLERKSAILFFLPEEILPKTGIVRENLEQYISETPIYDFIYGLISRELYEKQEYDSDIEICKLTDIDEYSEISLTSKRLISEFESLPWEYCLTLELDKESTNIFINENIEYTLSKEMRLIKPDESFKLEFPLQSGIEKRDRSMFGLGLLSIYKPQNWNSDAVYLQLFTKGFIGKYVTTTPLENAVSLLKSFFGISIALRLFKVEHSYQTTPQKLYLTIHRKTDENWVIEDTHDLDEEFTKTFNDLEIHDLDGVLNTPEKKAAWIAKNVDRISKIFRNKDQSEKIILAGQWFFESYCGTNQLLSFVQITVALEILLGDKAISDLMGLGELLRNRCAYLIGKSQEQRDKILKDFKEIYDVRSKIVHRGKSKLKLQERMLFNKLQWLCRRVIQEEVELITEDKNT